MACAVPNNPLPIRQRDTLMRSMLRLSVTTAMAGGVLLSATAQAQTREEIQRDQLDRQLRTEGQAVAVDGQAERAPCPLAGPEFSALQFTFTGASFSGLERIDASLVDPAFRDLIGRTVTVASICDIRDRAAAILRNAGYLASVQVPVQEIDAGNVRFDVVLARMSTVQVRGDAGPSGKALQRYIDRLAASDVFNVKEAERYLLLARDIPGLDVRLLLQPAPRGSTAQPGDVVGIFNVSRDPVQFDATIQNFGSKAVGRFGGFARVRLNGLTGLADQTSLSVYSALQPDEQHVVQAGHEMRLGGEGLTLGGNLTFAWSQPDIPGPNAFESETMIATAYAAYPFKRAQASNLIGQFGLEVINQDIAFTGLPLSKDRLRVAFGRLDFNAIDSASLTGSNGYSAIEPRLGVAGSVELRHGIGILDASESCGAGFANCIGPGVIPPSRLDADPTGLVVRAEAQLDFRPSPLWLVRLKPRVQYSPDALLSYEQVSGGNYTSGRGFDPGAVIGDSGYGGQIELAYGSLVPEIPGESTFQPYVFFDLMAVSTKNVPGDPQTISSVGGGVRATLGETSYLDIMAAVPLEKAPFQTQRGDVRILATLSVQL